MQIGPLLVPVGLWQCSAKPELVSSAGVFISTVLIQSMWILGQYQAN